MRSKDKLIKHSTKVIVPEYKSAGYLEVVIKNGSIMGWRATEVGMGRMKFKHSEHGEFRVNKGASVDWMRECWDDFTEFIESRM